MDEQAGKWGFLSKHARVLLVLAQNPDARLRDIAAACHVTERTAQSLIAALEQDGYLSRERAGRRTRYILCRDAMLRHPAEAHVPVKGLLELFTPQDSQH
ncbi:helix-turn-helix domain-containing protein [Streptomyces sp. YS415]|uniref:helix-turn-helix transcriptional regulator n=1 Tax=Streptomyces sp. YS415 TaxID=2944806 RepID=UPI0020202516|nr:helix-turn-helix domain-containing protein [Streptomyces sp. YS415]MCL7430389.1 MarR family transcriptional regulator [Streptomyces sp. YS415]